VPNILERVLQECVRLVIEPILEAHFFNHSYGFRLYRDAHMALERVSNIVHQTGYCWIVEGDIRRYFDTINHTKLIRQIWHLGIRDRRVLMIIKQMLKAGVMNETEITLEGTPQGGLCKASHKAALSLPCWLTSISTRLTGLSQRHGKKNKHDIRIRVRIIKSNH